MQICSVAEHATSEAFRESPKRLERIQGDVLAMLKADPRTRRLSIVMLSGSTSADDVEAALRSGARAHWTKPMDFARFISDIKAFLPAERR